MTTWDAQGDLMRVLVEMILKRLIWVRQFRGGARSPPQLKQHSTNLRLHTHTHAPHTHTNIHHRDPPRAKHAPHASNTDPDLTAMNFPQTQQATDEIRGCLGGGLFTEGYFTSLEKHLSDNKARSWVVGLLDCVLPCVQ